MALPVVGGFYVWCYMGFQTVQFLIEQYLEVRQLKKNREDQVPAELQGQVDEGKFLESQEYQKDKRMFGFFKDWVHYMWEKVGLFIINPVAWAFAVKTCGADEEVKCTLMWLFLIQWADKPLDIPLQLWSNFVVEAKHGFNKMTVVLFFTDMVKSEFLSYFFGGILIPLLIWIVQYTGDRFYLYLWGFFQVLMLVMMWVYPNIIQPMFNKFEQLKDEDLKCKIEELAAEVAFPLTKLFQIDGSKRSGHSNAYFFGFWKYKRIVLYDTLLHLKQEDILAILCHEFGHWKFGHTLFNLVISSLHVFILFWLFGMVMYSGDSSAEIIRQFGYGDTKAVMVSLMVFMALYSPTETAISMMMTILSRVFEFQADTFAHKMGRGPALQSGLFQIHEENKGDLNPDPWYSWYHHSHPPLVERLRAMRALDAKTK